MIAILILALMLVVGIAALIVHFLTKKALNAALGSLVAILASLATALVAPGFEGNAEIAFAISSVGKVSGKIVRVNPPQPATTWIIAFVSIAGLVAYTMTLIQRRDIALGKKP